MTFRPFLLSALLLVSGLAQAQTDSFTFPADLTGSPFHCKQNGSVYDCPAISISKDTTVTLTAPVTLNISGAFDVDKTFTTINNGNKLKLTVSGPVDFRKDLTGEMDLTVAGRVNFAKDAHFTGNITAAGNLIIAKDSWIKGNIIVSGNLDVGNDSYITGTCTVSGTSNYTCTGAPPPVTTRHHIRLDHSGSGLTCTPSTVTVHACSNADSGGSCTPHTGGIAGNVVATYSGGTATVPFTIPSNSSSVTVNVGVTTPGTATLSTSSLSPGTANPTTCWTGTSNSCALTFSDFGIAFDIPNLISNQPTVVEVRAIKTDTQTAACVPAFTSVTRLVNFACTYVNPNSSSKPLTITDAETGSSASLACPANNNVNLKFGATGIAKITVQYAEAGKLSVKGTLSGYSSTDDFVAVPSAFRIDLATANTYIAGRQFDATITAINATGGTTLNYEEPATGVALSFSRCQPVAPGSEDGTLKVNAFANFVDGASTIKAQWSEVGIGDLVAIDDNYMDVATIPIKGNTSGSANSCPGGSGKAGPFRPDHFSTEIDRANFTYSGQPIPMKVTARNAQDGITKNYFQASPPSQSFANDVTLSVMPSTAHGTLTLTKVPANKFTAGVAHAYPVFTFTAPLTAPEDISIRAGAADVSSAATWEQKTNIRTGRLRLSNVFSSNLKTATMPLRAEYWTGQSWILNSDDSGTDATTLPETAFVLSPLGTGSNGPSAAITLVDGQGTIPISPPAARGGYVNMAVNLGLDATDRSCLADHPASTGAKLPWLRSKYGNCADPADPSARASFGVYSPETRRTIHVRERFN